MRLPLTYSPSPLNISFDVSNIEKFFTEVRASLLKMQGVGIRMDDNIFTYDLLRRLPASIDNIKQTITHSKNGEDIVPQTLLDHLEIHVHKLKVLASNNKPEVTTMYTKKNKKCSPGKHNPLANHPAERFCSLSTFSSICPSSFILDSSSTAHMVSDWNLFVNLDENERGLINTSCGSNTLEIRGKGTISWLGVDFEGGFHGVYKLQT
ncbi:hypothetical protein VP01_175g1 [Puccinia sorghi]|uniref:Uncharacterized protein n=1 Tax=Puccinia sorghi TaxID=27349 RepID=A0A0L6VGS5_9BASI|nr:hypothetical protein VP01_175g1 [Puccinia sorghi]